MKVIFQGDAAPGVTVVSNEFIDRYMPSANGAFVKVYLYHFVAALKCRINLNCKFEAAARNAALLHEFFNDFELLKFHGYPLSARKDKIILANAFPL